MKVTNEGRPRAPVCNSDWNWGFAAGVLFSVVVWGIVAGVLS